MTARALRAAALAAAAGLIAYGLHVWRVVHAPVVPAGQTISITIEQGWSYDRIVAALRERGLIAPGPHHRLLARALSAETRIRAGDYQLVGPKSMLGVLRQLIEGRGQLLRRALIEGWTIREMLAAMAADPTIQRTEAPLRELGFADAAAAEGRCMPDTYRYHRGDTDLEILRLCTRAMAAALAELWPRRARGLPYAAPREALIMASIVEAETTLDRERAQVAGVLVGRLLQGIRLQADPTVIYGLGEDFDNNLTRAHLRQSAEINRYNTYRIHGLPPGPISNPGRKSLQAALHPDLEHGYLYYVAKGDGSHYFSKTYKEHRKAVRKYQLRR